MMVSAKYLSFAAVAVLALAGTGCLHDDGDGPPTDMMDVEDPGDGVAMPPGDGDTDMEEPEDGAAMPPGDPAALANVFDLVANVGRMEGGSWGAHRSSRRFSQATLTHSYGQGGMANVRISRDETGGIIYNVEIEPRSAELESPTGHYVQASRNIDTYPLELDGVTVSVDPIPDHELGDGWQVSRLTNDYDSGGTLSVWIATDMESSDMPVYPWAEAYDVADDHTILLDGVPALPGDKNFLVVFIGDGESLTGRLDGIEGEFSCAGAGGCVFIDDDSLTEYFVYSGAVTFTPEEGQGREQQLPAVIDLVHPGAASGAAADYLAFGHWLYVPEDVTDMGSYDFGVFGSGGQPFEVTNLAGLTGTAEYAGPAAGVYYMGRSGDDPVTGEFTASVALTADFGTMSEMGTVWGTLSGFAFGADVASAFPTSVELTRNIFEWRAEVFGVQQGETNVFDREYADASAADPGGWIDGTTSASVNGEDWQGHWSGVFYGNGDEPADHPTSIAGAFGSTNGTSGLAGSFGAHRDSAQDN